LKNEKNSTTLRRALYANYRPVVPYHNMIQRYEGPLVRKPIESFDSVCYL